ncbi:hypothetical protein GIB67_019390, partial [Kingdonia uniflora]
AIAKKGGQFLEASVSGSKKPAEDSQLVILAAGEKHPPHSMKEIGMRECPNFFPVSIIINLGLDTSVISPSVKHELKVSLDDTKREYYTIVLPVINRMKNARSIDDMLVKDMEYKQAQETRPLKEIQLISKSSSSSFSFLCS